MASEQKHVTRLAGGTSSLKAEAIPELSAPRGIDLGNSIVRHVGRVSIACMAPEARELLDRAMAAWAEFDAQRDPKPRDPVYAFAYWLFRWSGLIPLPTPTPAPTLREALEGCVQAMRGHNRVAHQLEGYVGDHECPFDFVAALTKAEAALHPLSSEGSAKREKGWMCYIL